MRLSFGHGMTGVPRGVSLGTELVTGGTFDDATGWTLGTGWSIASGVATISAPPSSSRLWRAASLTAGRTYLAQITVSAYIGGSMFFRLTNTGASVVTLLSALANGTYSAFVTLPSAANEVSIVAPNVLAAYSVDNVSVREVLG